MAEVIIKKESFPTRCEICHQHDQFDAAISLCQRCDAIAINTPQSAPEHKTPISNNTALTPLMRVFRCILLIFTVQPVLLFILFLLAVRMHLPDSQLLAIRAIFITAFINILFLIFAAIWGLAIRSFSLFKQIWKDQYQLVNRSSENSLNSLFKDNVGKWSISTGELVIVNILIIIIASIMVSGL